jgi:hypothetical protein
MSEHQQLSILRQVTAEDQDGQAEHPARKQVHDLEQHPPSQPLACLACLRKRGQPLNRVVERHRFGDIFRTNATKAGLLPVILPEAIVSALQDAVEADPGTEVTVDLGRREVRAGAAGRRARPARAVRAARRAQLGRRARAARRARRGSGLRSRSTNIPAGGCWKGSTTSA